MLKVVSREKLFFDIQFVFLPGTNVKICHPFNAQNSKRILMSHLKISEIFLSLTHTHTHFFLLNNYFYLEE